MTPSARVLADSISSVGHRLTTMEVTFHRFVLAEFNTHRVFSRNSASSRAIPVETQLDRVVLSPAWPVEWPAEQAGMQGGNALADDDFDDARMLFSDVKAATQTLVDGYLRRHPDKSTRLHKSLINRLLEPFMWHTVIVTATDWDGFWEQRCSSLAQPEIRVAAEAMKLVYDASTPKLLLPGAWHTPLIQPDEDEAFWENSSVTRKDIPLNTYRARGVWLRKRVSSARCARVSYLTHGGRRDINADLTLFGDLTVRDGSTPRRPVGAPVHWSPLEHVATPCPTREDGYDRFKSHTHRGNFTGFDQFRHEIEETR